jgi:hypothetical protein
VKQALGQIVDHGVSFIYAFSTVSRAASLPATRRRVTVMMGPGLARYFMPDTKRVQGSASLVRDAFVCAPF